MQKACGLLETPYNFFIDHLAPLCVMLDIPLISSKPHTKLLYQKYYPDLKIELKNWDITTLIQHYTYVFYSFIPEPPFKSLIKKAIKNNPTLKESMPTYFIHHFHGCSDKGYNSKWIEKDGYFSEIDLMVMYGKRMSDLLKDKGLYHLPNHYVYLGNYRLAYYKQYQAFFDQKVENDIFSKIESDIPTILYAPTWQDHEDSSSFLSCSERLFQTLSKKCNIIVKLHPNMTLKTKNYDPKAVNELITKHQDNPHIFFLPFYPLIYPILKRCSLYIGDYSSVSYDALSFMMPLIFLNHNGRESDNKGAYIFRCGESISQNELHQIDQIVEKALNYPDTYLKIKQETYQYAFGKDLPFDTLREKLEEALLDLSKKVLV